MHHFVGLDVAVKKTQICIMDADQKVVSETKVPTDPESIAMYLYEKGYAYSRVGLEAGTQAFDLYRGLSMAGLPVLVLETRHAAAFIKTIKTNKNDKNDARGLAQMMAAKIYKPVHVKTEDSQRMRAYLNTRKTLQKTMGEYENKVRATLSQFGLAMGTVSRPNWEARVRELVEGDTFLLDVVEPLIECWRVHRVQFLRMERSVGRIARADPICRRLMTCPGVGPVVSMMFKTTIDIPERFKKSQMVGAAIGLTPRQYQSGGSDVKGRITKAGDVGLRSVLVEAAFMVMRSAKKSWLTSWAKALTERTNPKKAAIAVARKLAVVMHRMWMDGTNFRWAREPELALAA